MRGLATLALADAQQLTLLRAKAKGNQPSLISSIAADTAQLYSQAGGQVGGWAFRVWLAWGGANHTWWT